MKHCPCRRTLLQGQQHMNQSFLFSVVDVYLFPTCSLLTSRENTFSPPKMWWVLPFRLIVQREEKFRRHQRRQQSQWKRRKWGVNVELRQKCVCSKWERFILSKKMCGCPDDYECTMKRTRKAWKREGQKKKRKLDFMYVRAVTYAWTDRLPDGKHLHWLFVAKRHKLRKQSSGYICANKAEWKSSWGDISLFVWWSFILEKKKRKEGT